jgi:hypothetical protein
MIVADVAHLGSKIHHDHETACDLWGSRGAGGL